MTTDTLGRMVLGFLAYAFPNDCIVVIRIPDLLACEAWLGYLKTSREGFNIALKFILEDQWRFRELWRGRQELRRCSRDQ